MATHRRYVRTFLSVLCIYILLVPAAASAVADGRALDDAAWRADIAEVAENIRSVHPRPFRDIESGDFDAAVEDLHDSVPQLSDKEIIVRLAALVAMIDDGHTRLAIPRQHPEIALEFGHTPTPPPSHVDLEFRQLPLAFAKFEDGVFVVSAAAEFAEFIGHKVTAIDGAPIDEAFTAVQAITFAENSQLEALMGADRLTLVEALAALGISASTKTVLIDFEDQDGAPASISIDALGREPVHWQSAFDGMTTPLRLRNTDEKFWSEYLADQNIVYMQIDEIADAEVSLAEFVTATLKMATEKNAKLVIDIRNNFGGSGGLNKTLVTALIQNQELNQYDRTFVITGRRTFSAAQMLVNELEQYTRVTMVGEPTGSRPDHYGDPKKLRLEHSGLTLRVSRLHWSSYTAFDERDAAIPDLPIYWTSDNYFSGADPALALVSSVPNVDLETLLRSALRRGDLHQISRYTLDSKLATDTFHIDFSNLLVKLGKEFEDANNIDAASFTYRVGLYFYPEQEALLAALESIRSS